MKVECCYRLTLDVDYGKSIKQMVIAGNYDNAGFHDLSDYYQQDVKRKSVQTVRVQLLKISDDPSTATVLRLCGQHGKVAGMPEVLAIGQYYPDLQKQYVIPALAKPFMYNERPWVPYLGYSLHVKLGVSEVKQRILAVMTYNVDRWPSNCLFPVILT